jgi:hypothetical protein
MSNHRKRRENLDASTKTSHHASTSENAEKKSAIYTG